MPTPVTPAPVAQEIVDKVVFEVRPRAGGAAAAASPSLTPPPSPRRPPLQELISREMGAEAVLKVRTSPGLRV